MSPKQKSSSPDEYFNNDEFSKMFREMEELIARENEFQNTNFPPNPPNDKCRHAIIEGIGFSNSAGLRTGDYHPLFTFGKEQAFVWTHTKNKYSALIVEVDESVHNLRIWKTLGRCIQIASAFVHGFEHLFEVNYEWIYYFNSKIGIDEQSFWVKERFPLGSSIQRLRYLIDIAPILELLHRDEVFFVAAQNLYSSIQNHYFCLICAYQKEGHRKHPNHEHEMWQIAEQIPAMEAAIVQATRAVEAIIGKPGKREKNQKLDRLLQRWGDKLDLNPKTDFPMTSGSYLDYYYDLFGIRGDAAHSLGKLPYQLSRRLTIEAQCFAWEMIRHYYKKFSLSTDEAVDYLKLNVNLINQEPEDVITVVTADGK